MKTYADLLRFNSFEERFEYLRLNGRVSELTFAGHRHLNQMLYESTEWKEVRRRIILRDDGCDLGISERPIYETIFIHHMNPLSIDDVIQRKPCVFDEENLICCSFNTHNAIHYGDSSILMQTNLVNRMPGDTCPWRR